ncbi:MAG: winged helix-turn-helix domain-containing protein [bacterium]|nr:winged helix-turn-helix domain-containing protein [bacterium]
MKFGQFFLFLALLLSTFSASADQSSEEQRRAVLSRKVGDEVLLMIGDSVTIVDPVKQEGSRYTISFATEFAFRPEVLTAVVDSVLQNGNIKSSYFLEVLNCSDNAIVYDTYRGGELQDSLDIVNCNTREYPKACYKIALTFYADEQPKVAAVEEEAGASPVFDPSDPYSWFLFVGAALLLFSGYAYFKRKKEQSIAEHIIPIGAYLFDQRSMHLTYNGETVELTSKEADLLFLLHSSKNQTVERDTILRIVWGDEGDYVGRTLDVFISKLRKKLADDPKIKIANIRGVGYRLVVDVT